MPIRSVELPTSTLLAIARLDELLLEIQPAERKILPFKSGDIAAVFVRPQDRHDVRLRPAPVFANFGDLPTVVEPDARELLASLPARPLRSLLEAIRKWVSLHSEVQRIKVLSVSEPDDRSWRELVVEIRVGADMEHALRLWDDMARQLTEVRTEFDPQDQHRFNRLFAVHVVWQEDDDE